MGPNGIDDGTDEGIDASPGAEAGARRHGHAMTPPPPIDAAELAAPPDVGLRDDVLVRPVEYEAVEAVPAAPPPPAGSLTLDAVLAPYVIIFCIAFAVSYIFTPLMRQVAIAYDVVDRPDAGSPGGRKLHRRPVAYLGGVAVFLGFIASLALGQFFSETHHPDAPDYAAYLRVPLPVVFGGTVIVALGLLDDLRGVKPNVKIIGQVAAAVCLLGFGIGTDIAGQFVRFVFAWMHRNVGLEFPLPVETWASVTVSCGFVIALVVFCCNASNLMDGLDGLCGGVTAIIAFGLVVLAAHLAMTGPGGRAPDDAARLAISLALFGAVLGFLPFNFNPASIFMGDAGSLLMGFVIASLIVMLGEVGGKWMLGGLVMFSLPVLDTALAFARRWLKGRPLFSADKHHFHHQLMARGLTVRRAVVLSYGLTVFFVLSGAFMAFLRTRYLVAFYLVLFGSIIVAAFKMGMVHERVTPEGEGDGNFRG